jgi:hypothetical protein
MTMPSAEIVSASLAQFALNTVKEFSHSDVNTFLKLPGCLDVILDGRNTKKMHFQAGTFIDVT